MAGRRKLNTFSIEQLFAEINDPAKHRKNIKNRKMDDGTTYPLEMKLQRRMKRIKPEVAVAVTEERTTRQRKRRVVYRED